MDIALFISCPSAHGGASNECQQHMFICFRGEFRKKNIISGNPSLVELCGEKNGHLKTECIKTEIME